MKKAFIVICLVLFFHLGFAQTNLSIIYNSYSFRPDKPNKETASYWKYWLVINDSISYLKPWKEKTDTLDLVVGNKFQLHGLYRNYHLNKSVTQSQPKDNPELKIIDSIKKKDWVLSNETKRILGYNCFKAMLVDEYDNHITAWYTKELPAFHSPSHNDGLPGTILEIIDFTHKSTLRATIVSNRKVEIVEPQDGELITKEDFKKVVQKINKN